MNDDATAADYNDPMSLRQLGIAADVLRSFGGSFGGKHLALVGGIVPGLLVTNPPEGIEPHVGTSDLDLLISIALLEGDTADYYGSIVEGLRSLNLAPDEADERTNKWRWVGTIETNLGSVSVIVEFLCPQTDRAGRPQAPTAGTPAEQNFGSSSEITALQMKMGHLVAQDTIEVKRQVQTTQGLLDYTFPVADLGSWLALKTDAIEGRSKAKDSYDIVWTIAGLGPEAAAERVARSKLLAGEHADETRSQIDKLINQFSTDEHVGPQQFAVFMGSDNPARDRRYALGAVNQFAQRWRQPRN